jgi:hypothetical protein
VRGILISICLILIAVLHDVFLEFVQIKTIDLKYTFVFILSGLALATLSIIRSYDYLSLAELTLIVCCVIAMAGKTLFTYLRRNNL